MNAIQLYKQDGSPVGVWYCGECRKVWMSDTDAERCCQPKICNWCDKPMPSNWGMLAHSECIEERRLRESEKLETWDGWVYHEGFESSNNGYFESVDTLMDAFADEEIEPPEFAFVAKEQPFAGIKLYRVLEDLTEDMFEDAVDHLNGCDKLGTAIDDFNKVNANLVSYFVDYTRMVRLPKVDTP